MMRILLFSIILCSMLIVDVRESFAQRNQQYSVAMQYMRQNEYEKAYEILKGLVEKEPGNFPVFDQALNALVELKRYDEAIDLATRRLGRDYQDIVVATRLGELYHLNDDTEKAYEVWQRALDANSNSLQAYRYIGDMMRNRREYAKSVELYETARTKFNNQTLFFTEITTNYMAMGRHDLAVVNLVDVLAVSPGNSTFVQRQIISFDEPAVVELAIVELSERSRSLSRGSAEYIAFQEVSIALLLEQRLFRRALVTARSLESVASEGSWPVYTIANRLRSQEQFELADEAYQFYADRDRHPLQARSREDRATLYILWSRSLTAKNIDYDGKATELYKKADQILQDLLQQFPNYQRRTEVLSTKADLALDYLKNVSQAEHYLTQIQQLPNNSQNDIIAGYVEGRILMFKGSHSLARVQLTRANRNARTGEWAERTRYFLALNDFYTGDFEFAAIQMRPLERLSTSYYANDALKLRLWIQEGRIDDEPTDELKRFSRARFLFDTGNVEEAIEQVLPLITTTQNVPLRGEALLLGADYLRTVNAGVTFSMLDKSLKGGFNGPQRERLMWERARIADGISKLLSSNESIVLDEVTGKLTPLFEWTQTSGDCTVFLRCYTQPIQNTTASDRTEQVFTLYEDILFEYPQGFYADAIRNRLREIQSEINL